MTDNISLINFYNNFVNMTENISVINFCNNFVNMTDNISVINFYNNFVNMTDNVSHLNFCFYSFLSNKRRNCLELPTLSGRELRATFMIHTIHKFSL